MNASLRLISAVAAFAVVAFLGIQAFWLENNPGGLPRFDTSGEESFFLNALSLADVNSPSGYINGEYVDIYGQAFNSIFAHPPSSIAYHRISVQKDAPVFKAHIAVHPESMKHPGDGVIFSISLKAENGITPLFHRYVDPRSFEPDRAWIPVFVDLSPWISQNVTLILETSTGFDGDSTCDWAYWGKPLMVSEKMLLHYRSGIPSRKIIFLSIDTLRPDHLGLYGYERNTSPNLDRFSKLCRIFDRAYSTAPWTLPSHASMFTGVPPLVHKMDSIVSILDEGFVTLAEVLESQNFSTAAFVDCPLLLAKYNLDQGFGHYDEKMGGAESVFPRALEWLSSQTGDAFAFIHVFDPHGPYEAPEEFAHQFRYGETEKGREALRSIKETGYHKYQKMGAFKSLEDIVAAYDAEIALTDREFGKFMDTLQEQASLDDFLIVVVSDHGESLFEHQLYVGHGLFLYENELRVPLLVKYPGSWGRNPPHITGRHADAVTTMDLFWLVLDVVNRSTPPSITQTKSLRTGSPFASGPVYAFSSNLGGTSTIIDGEWKFREILQVDSATVIDHRLHPLTPHRRNQLLNLFPVEEALFNLEADPLETQNMIGSLPGMERQLKNTFRLIMHQWNKGISASSSHAMPEDAELSPEEIEQLRALGYLK